VKLLCAVALVVAARTAAAQSSWQDLMGALSGGPRPVPAVGFQECYPPPLRPDSVYVLPDIDDIAILSVWQPDTRRWVQRTSTPYRGEPMAFRVTRMRCAGDDPQPRLIYLTRDNHTIALEGRDTVSPVQLLRVRSRVGDLSPITYLLLGGRWILTDSMSANDSLARLRNAAAERRQRLAAAQAREAERATRRRRLAGLGWKASVVDDVLNGYISLGMTKAQVRESWGDPDRVSTTINQSGTSEQWLFASGSLVSFRAGKVKSISQSR